MPTYHKLKRGAALVLALWCAALLLAGCGGGGGGGGGPVGQTTTVTGTILRGENGTAPPSPGATITIGGATTTTNTDGAFTLTNAPANATTATVSAAAAKPRTLTINLNANATNNLGTIYLSDTGYTATVTGTVVTPANNTNQPVGGATVTLAGTSTTTASNGTFRIDNLPVGLGTDAPGTTVVGQVTATGFDAKPITVDTIRFPLQAGVNALDPIVISGGVSGTVPLPPYTIALAVTSGGQPNASAAITIARGTTQLGGATAAGTQGNYYFWVVPGTYTITAKLNGVTKTATVTLARADSPVSTTIAFP